jgi:hypothetical protein
MDTKEQNLIAEGVGQALGELLGAFLMVIEALRKQPGFDDAAFRATLEQRLADTSLSRLQRHTLERLMENK